MYKTVANLRFIRHVRTFIRKNFGIQKKHRFFQSFSGKSLVFRQKSVLLHRFLKDIQNQNPETLESYFIHLL